VCVFHFKASLFLFVYQNPASSVGVALGFCFLALYCSLEFLVRW
jgi:hypothetical protein